VEEPDRAEAPLPASGAEMAVRPEAGEAKDLEAERAAEMGCLLDG